MERLLHYTWKNRLMPSSGIHTVDGKEVRILSVGLHNKDAGPDFFNADIIIDGEDWIGNVEIHTRSTDWYRHGHDHDPAYDNVILHVVEQADGEVVTSSGRTVPQIEVQVPDHVVSGYEQLQIADSHPPCLSHAAGMAPFLLSQWLGRLCRQRLERKAADIESRLQYCDHDWEHAFFITLARAFGFSINSDAFEQWARIIPYRGAAKHRDNILQIEALFLGQAGFLDSGDKALDLGKDSVVMAQEYRFLSNKFSLTPLNVHSWRFLRTRPSNFPTVRLRQLAHLYCEGRVTLSAIVDAPNADAVARLFEGIRLPQASVNLLLLNAVVPMLYAYGAYRGSKKLKDKALLWLSQLPPEANRYTRLWQQAGLPLGSAADSQAVVQQFTRLCERRDCLRCQLGYQYMKNH